MPASLQLLDAAGVEVSLGDANPVDFGTVTTGTTSDAKEMKVKNSGDVDVFFARVRAIQHPTAQVGAAADTFAATEFALTEDGAYAAELELGTLAPAEEKSFWVRWAVPAEAPPGAAVWAAEALGSVT